MKPKGTDYLAVLKNIKEITDELTSVVERCRSTEGLGVWVLEQKLKAEIKKLS